MSDPNELFPLEKACEVLLYGTVKPSTLRAEAKRGNLRLIRLGKRDLVTRAAVNEMLERCQPQESLPDSGSDRHGEMKLETSSAKRRTSFSTEESISPRDALRAQLRTLDVPSRRTLKNDTGPSGKRATSSG
jgi:hypothetical protein